VTAALARIVAAVRAHSVCATTVDNSGVYVYYLKGIVSVDTARERCRQQHKADMDGDEWSAEYALLEVTRHKSSQLN